MPTVFTEFSWKRIVIASVVILVGTTLTFFELREKPSITNNDPCLSNSYWQLAYPCYNNQIQTIIQARGIEAALSYIDEIVKENSYLPLVHLIYHTVGYEAYYTTQNKEKALTYLVPYEKGGTFDFSLDGFRHGVMMAFFEKNKETKSMSELLHEACADYFDISSPNAVQPQRALVAGQCFHIVGHGLMYGNRNDVIMSLNYCDSLPYAWMKKACYHGVFMENAYLYSSFYHPEAPRPSVTENTMLTFCLQFEGRKLEECGRFVGWTVFNRNYGDIEGALEECQELPEGNQKICITEAAIIFIPSLINSFGEMIHTCKSLRAELIESCLTGVAVGIKVGSAGKINQEKPFCELIDEENLRKTCFETLMRIKYGRHH